jgi:hypothetical protein
MAVCWMGMALVMIMKVLHAICSSRRTMPDVIVAHVHRRCVDDVEFLWSSGAVFARKFKASDYRILDELDAVVLTSPNGP